MLVPAFDLELLKEFLNVTLGSRESRNRLDTLRADVGREKRSSEAVLAVKLLACTTLDGSLDQVVAEIAGESSCEVLTYLV